LGANKEEEEEAAGEAVRIEASDWANSGLPQDLANLALPSSAAWRAVRDGFGTHTGE